MRVKITRKSGAQVTVVLQILRNGDSAIRRTLVHEQILELLELVDVENLGRKHGEAGAYLLGAHIGGRDIEIRFLI
jgi:hypothetical protein